MRKIIPTVFTLCALAVAITAAAADPGASRAEKRAEWRQTMFDKLDANHDGTISRAEYQDWVDSRFDALDTNGDGVVDASEVANSKAAAERVHKRAERFVRRYDATGNGQVSRADFEAKEMQRFDRIGNGADSISEDAFMSARPMRHRHGGPAPTDGG